VFTTRVIVYRATVSAVSCLVVPVFICIYLLIVMCFEIKLNDDISSSRQNTADDELLRMSLSAPCSTPSDLSVIVTLMPPRSVE